VINGAGVMVAIDGPHAFNSLVLTNGTVLTHSACTATNTHKLDLQVTNGVVVSANSRIDVSEKGYVGGRTTGNTTNGAACGACGGSYGGPGCIFTVWPTRSMGTMPIRTTGAAAAVVTVNLAAVWSD